MSPVKVFDEYSGIRSHLIKYVYTWYQLMYGICNSASFRGFFFFFFCDKVVTKEGSRRGTVVQVPYPTRSDAESAMPPVKKEDPGEEAAAASLGLEEEKAKEKARKVPYRC